MPAARVNPSRFALSIAPRCFVTIQSGTFTISLVLFFLLLLFSFLEFVYLYICIMKCFMICVDIFRVEVISKKVNEIA